MPTWRWRGRFRTRACAGSSLAIRPRRGLSLARARTKMRAFGLVVVGARGLSCCCMRAVASIASCVLHRVVAAAAALYGVVSRAGVRGTALRPSMRANWRVPAAVSRWLKRFASAAACHLCCRKKPESTAQSSVQNAAPRPSRATKVVLRPLDTCCARLLHSTAGQCVSSHHSLSLQQCTLWHRCETARRPVQRFVAFTATGDILPRCGRQMVQILCKRGAAARAGALEASCGRAPTTSTTRWSPERPMPTSAVP